VRNWVGSPKTLKIEKDCHIQEKKRVGPWGGRGTRGVKWEAVEENKKGLPKISLRGANSNGKGQKRSKSSTLGIEFNQGGAEKNTPKKKAARGGDQVQREVSNQGEEKERRRKFNWGNFPGTAGKFKRNRITAEKRKEVSALGGEADKVKT